MQSRLDFDYEDNFFSPGTSLTPEKNRLSSIDLFSLYVLSSHFRQRDANRGNSFFQMSSYARANVRITNDKNKRKIPMRASGGLKWENKALGNLDLDLKPGFHIVISVVSVVRKKF